MANEMIRIFLPLKIITYPEYGSDDFVEEITPTEAVAYEDAILTHHPRGASYPRITCSSWTLTRGMQLTFPAKGEGLPC